MKKKNIVLSFDLDNTLIDNKEGIVNSFNYALRKFNLQEMSKFKVEKMIGIPLNEMFANVTNLNPSKMCIAFRDYYATKGIFQANLLLGVIDKLDELHKLSFQLGIITSKRQDMAIKIVKILKIYKYFNYILGESDDVKSKLDPKLKDILYRMYPDKKKIIIIGDHPKDAMLSKFLGCPFIGVLTGFHSSEDLKSQRTNKILILDSVNEITTEHINSLI